MKTLVILKLDKFQINKHLNKNEKNIIDTLFPVVSLDVIVANALGLLNDKEPAIRALKTDKSVIVSSEKEAVEVAIKAIKAGIVVTSIEALLQDGYTIIGDVQVDVTLPTKYIIKCK